MISSPRYVFFKLRLLDLTRVQNFLVDGSGHVKLTDFGLATGALNPRRIESLKGKVGPNLHKFSQPTLTSLLVGQGERQ